MIIHDRTRGIAGLSHGTELCMYAGLCIFMQLSPESLSAREYRPNCAIIFHEPGIYIIGYGFGDEHINHAISERLQKARRPLDPRPVKLFIIDYAESVEDKGRILERINNAIGATEQFIEVDRQIHFGGANCIPK